MVAKGRGLRGDSPTSVAFIDAQFCIISVVRYRQTFCDVSLLESTLPPLWGRSGTILRNPALSLGSEVVCLLRSLSILPADSIFATATNGNKRPPFLPKRMRARPGTVFYKSVATSKCTACVATPVAYD